MSNKYVYMILDHDKDGYSIRGLYDCSPKYLSSFDTKRSSFRTTQVIKIPLNKEIDQFITK